MSSKIVEELENIFCDNARYYLIHNWIDTFLLDRSPKFLLHLFRKCSKQFLAYQDDTYSSMIHGLVKSHMPSSNKMKSLKMLLSRGVNCNKLDGNKKSILDYLVEDNDLECIKILLEHGQNLIISGNCLSRSFQLRNTHEEIFRLLFAYAIKHKVAPNLTGILDGDTFLHEIMIHEKEMALFKKWMGFFLSFPEININAINNDGLTIFDLLLLNYKKKRCKCAIKLLIKYRFSKINCVQPQLYSFKSRIKKKICNHLSKKAFFSISVFNNENLELNSTNNELSIISSGKGFSHKYLKLKHAPMWSYAKSLQTLNKSSDDSRSVLSLPNYEETEIIFKVEIFDKTSQRSKTKQTHLPELANAKKYLSSKEAIALITKDNYKVLTYHPKKNTKSKKDEYMEKETKKDLASNSKQLLQESSTIRCTAKDTWNKELLLNGQTNDFYYYAKDFCLSLETTVLFIEHYNRGCVRFDVSECIIQGMKLATTPCKVITKHPVLKTKPNKELRLQNASGQKETSIYSKILLIGALPFPEINKHAFKAVTLCEQRVQNNSLITYFSNKIDENYKCFKKIREYSQVHSSTIACLQDDCSHRPTIKQLHCNFIGYEPVILLHNCVSKISSQEDKKYDLIFYNLPEETAIDIKFVFFVMKSWGNLSMRPNFNNLSELVSILNLHNCYLWENYNLFLRIKINHSFVNEISMSHNILIYTTRCSLTSTSTYYTSNARKCCEEKREIILLIMLSINKNQDYSNAETAHGPAKVFQLKQPKNNEDLLQTGYKYLQLHKDKIHEKTELATKTSMVCLKDSTEIKKSSFSVSLHHKCYEHNLFTNHIYNIFPCRLPFNIIPSLQNWNQYVVLSQVITNIVPYNALLHDQNEKFEVKLIFFTKDMDMTKANNKTLEVESKNAVSNLTDTMCKVMKFYIREDNIIDEVSYDFVTIIYNNTHLQQFVDVSENAIKIARYLQKSVNTKIHEPRADDIENAISWNIQSQKLKNLYQTTHIMSAVCLQITSTFKELYFSNNNISDGAADDIAAIIYSNTRPKKFNACKNLQLTGAIKITKVLLITCILKELNISDNHIGDEADANAANIHCYTPLQQFNNKNNYTLMELDINDNYIIDKMANIFTIAIPYNTELQQVDFDMTGLHPEDITKITKPLQNNLTLKRLCISTITDETINDNAATICCFIKLQQFNVIEKYWTLKKLESYNYFIDKMVDHFATTLFYNNTIQELDISMIYLCAEYFIKLKKALQNIKFNGDKNNNTEKAIAYIASALSFNGQLQEFSKSGKHIKTLQNTAALYKSNTDKGVNNIATLCTQFQEFIIEALQIKDNRLPVTNAKNAAQAVSFNNTKLQILVLSKIATKFLQSQGKFFVVYIMLYDDRKLHKFNTQLCLELNLQHGDKLIVLLEYDLSLIFKSSLTNGDEIFIPLKDYFILKYNYIATHLFVNYMKSTNIKELALSMQGRKTIITDIVHENENKIDGIVAVFINIADLHLCKTYLQINELNNTFDGGKKSDAINSTQGFSVCTLSNTCSSKIYFKESCIFTKELQKLYWDVSIFEKTEIQKNSLQMYFGKECTLQYTNFYYLFSKLSSDSTKQRKEISQIHIVSTWLVSVETENTDKSNPATTKECQLSRSTKSRYHCVDSNGAQHSQESINEVEVSTPYQVIDNSFQLDNELFCFPLKKDHLHVLEVLDSEANVNMCVDNLPESLTFRFNSCSIENESTSFISNTVLKSLSATAQESFQHFVQPSESFSVSVIRKRIYVPSHSVSTISCSNISINETVLREGVLFGKEENATRGNDEGSDSSSDEDNNDQGIHSSFVSHSSNPSAPRTSARTSHISAKYLDGRMRDAAAPPQAFMGVGMSVGMLTKSSSVYANSGDNLISGNLAERGPILLDIPNGRNELVIAAHSNLSIPKLYPIVGFRKEPPGIALPPPIPLDLPKIDFNKKVSSHRQLVREQPVQTGSDVGTVPKTLPTSNVTSPQLMASSHQQQTLNQSIDHSDPVSIISRASLFLNAGDYGATIKVLEILDKHLLLPDEVDMAKEFGQGLANFKNLHYRAARPCFTALFEKATNHHSTGDQALASIYLGEIEMSWAKYKDAVKHFTIAVTHYSTDNVAEKFQQTILSKSAILVKKGHSHRSLSQIKEAINAFKTAKEVAESRQEQAIGSKLKTAKEDELSAVCALGNILQSIGDYEQSFDYYQKSLTLAVELEDRVSIGWAHGNLGNAMLGLDQKDKALDHLITAFHMSARHEGNPLAVGRAVSNLGNAYQAIGNLPKAKEHYEIALGHAIYGNDLQGQGRACGNIGNIYMLLKEPVKAVHYYTETLRLSTDKNTKITGHHNRGCARFDVAEYIVQGKKPKELVPATTPGSEYGRLAIKLTDEVITTDPVLETKPNREASAQSVSEQKESSMPVEMLPIIIKGKAYEGIGSVDILRTAEALPFLETSQRDLFEAIQSHEQGVQNVKGSHEALSLSLSLFESNSRSFYKMQETLVELGKLYQKLSRLGLMDMSAADPQEFKDALVYGEQARARTLGELVLQKKKTTYSELFSICTPLTIQDIYKTVNLQKFPVVFLSYCVSKLLIWILVKKEDEVVMRCQSIELKEEELENGSFELYIRYNLLQFLSKDEIYIFRRCAYEQESPFTVLHDVIAIKIIEGLKSIGLSEVTEFIVIPDSVTHLLPFSPLMNKHNWQFFGDKYRIRIVPSFLSLLVMSMTSNPIVEIPGDKSDFLIVGNPTIPPFMYDSTQWNLGRLPYAEKEAISVANIIGTIPVLREQATKQSVLYRLRSAKVIHLATHGSASGGFLAFTSSFPISKSGLADKEHILIFPKEIETLNISPALVVLSSCDSARGQVKAEGVIGMARAFLSAGAHSVLVSLWRVPDESANVFMNFFYQFLVNGLPSLQALQRSMQCLRCFLKYSHYVHWSGFQIIGKEVSFHKDSSTQFPIQKMLGEVSTFPRQQVKVIEENLLGVTNKIYTDIQLLVGTPGNEPEECVRDFIKNCYCYYPSGVYWYDATNELLLETSMKIAHEMPLVGAVYKEQKNPDPLPTISNPSLLTTKSNKPTSRKDKRLIVLHNFTSLDNYHFVMREMKDASTDIIVVSNELFCKEEVAQEFDKYFNRGCNIIEVGNLQPISILQRIVYGLLEKNSFVARDADHIVFTLLSEYSRGAATVVHMLTSLMQKSDDNSRTGFELAKQQLKLHMANLRLGLDKHGMHNSLSKANSFANPTAKVQHRGGNVTIEKEFGVKDDGHFSACQRLEQPPDDVNKQDNVGKSKQNDDVSESQITIMPECYIMQEPRSSKAKGIKKSSNNQLEDKHAMTSSIIAESDDNKHATSSDATHLPDTIELEKEGFVSTKKHPLYMYISDILSTTSNISLPAHHLLNCLAITGPIPLPLFYVEELDKVVMNAVFNKEKKRIQAESPMKQLIKEGVIRRSCYPIIYHKDLNTDYIDLGMQQITVPKLICDAVKDEMDDIDKVLVVLSAQEALENLMIHEIKLSLIHLEYLLILSNQLHDVCTKQLHGIGDELLINIQKLILQVAVRSNQFKS